MAFDIYVGPVSRYVSRDWKNTGQRIAEEQGFKYVMITPRQGGLLSRLFKPKPKPDDIYARWRAEVRAGLASVGFEGPEWDDSAGQDYVTDRPGWEGHVAFVAQLAYARNPEMTPPTKALTMPELAEDPAFEAELEIDGSPVITIMSSKFFLPGDFAKEFTVTDFAGQPVSAASITVLKQAVQLVCSHCGFDSETLERAALEQVDDDVSFEDATRYGAAIYAQLVREAVTRKLPLILDY